MVPSPFSSPQTGRPAQPAAADQARVATRTDDEVRHVALVGMPGAGKSVVGPLLAERLGCAFVDLDEAVAQAAHKSVAALFAEAGEVMFRAKERARLRELLARPEPTVIACGGGTWADATMQRELLAAARPVLLSAPLEVLLQRLEDGGGLGRRPLLHGPSPRAALERLWRAREPMHAACPRALDTAALEPFEVARRVAALLAREAEQAPGATDRGAPEVTARQPAQPAAGDDTAATPPADAGAPVAGANGPVADGGSTEAREADEANTGGAAGGAGRAGAEAGEAGGQVRGAGAGELGDGAKFHGAIEVWDTDGLQDGLGSPDEDRLADERGARDPAAPQPGAEAQDLLAPPDVAGPAGEVGVEGGIEVLSLDEGEAALPLLRAPGLHADYPVYLLREGAAAVAACIDAISTGNRVAVISDTGVAPNHAPKLLEALRARGLEVSLHVFAAGEENKRLATAHALYDELSDAGHGRGDLVVALGGGVVGDVAGFVASTYVRGVPFVQVPCSTLAAVDACIGSKTGLNTRRGKNLVGSLHDPAAVVVSLPYLGTQPPRVHAAGLVEALKVAALADAELFLAMQAAGALHSGRTPELLGEVVGRALALKARFVGADVQEHGERALLNFGHTVGHAIEVGHDYTLLHGEAVGLGMLAEAEWAEANGLSHGVVEPLQQALRALGVPADWRRAKVDLDAMTRDKKRRGEFLSLPVVMPLGTARLHEVPMAELAQFVAAQTRG